MREDKVTRNDQFGTAADGVDKHLAAQPTVLVNGEPMKPADVSAALRAPAAAAAKTSAALTAYRQAVAAEEEAAAAAHAILLGLKETVTPQFKKQPDVLNDFGFHLTVRHPLTAAQKEAANAKRQATRKARGIVGRKQRKAIVAAPPKQG